MKVLVLEDDPALLFALTQTLEDAGHTAFAAYDIPTACDLLGQVTPDLLLLDLMIGKIESIQIADLAGYRAPDAEVIYLTGSNKYPSGELFQLSKNAAWILRKPIDFNDLQWMLAHLESSPSKSPKSKPKEVSASF